MGLRGPAPTDSRIIESRGTGRADRPRDDSEAVELTPLTELPKPPGFLDRVGKMEWNRVGPELVAKQLLTGPDMAAFTTYCVNVARVAACEIAIREHGMTYIGPNAAVCQRPEVAISRQCGAEARRFAQEFACTPASRRRVRVAAKAKAAKPVNPFELVK